MAMKLRLVFLFCIFSPDLSWCETAAKHQTEDPATIPGAVPLESQISLSGETQPTTEASKFLTETPKRNDTNSKKPSCRIVYKDVPAPANHPSGKEKITMACTVCNVGDYKESCVYADTQIVTDEVTQPSPLAEESRQSITVESFKKGPKKYAPQTTAATSRMVKERKDEVIDTYIPGRAEMDSKDQIRLQSRRADDDDEEEEEEKVAATDFEEALDEKATAFFQNFIPKEYTNLDYNPKFYESHDAAANVFHKVPYDNQKSSRAQSGEEDSGEESRHSYHHALPGFKKLKETLPDVDPIDVDKVKPRKTQKTIEYNEETVFSSDDDNGKKTKKVVPRFTSMDSQGEQSRNNENYESSGTNHGRGNGNHGHGHHHHDDGHHGHDDGHTEKHGSQQYKPPFDMPAFDTKDCKVTYKESPNGQKMKCMSCKDKHNAYSEECGMEYEEPTKHKEVYYNSQNYNPHKKPAQHMYYGTEHRPYYYPYHGSSFSSGKKFSESRRSHMYMPYDEFYYPYD